MLRQVSSRNHRSKGFKVKHALQIFLLVAICIWLLYQVKHSHEKKKAFEERNLKMNKAGDNQADFFKFGRKDLPHIEDRVSVDETHDKEEENEEIQGEGEEHDAKQEEIEDEEGRGAGEDEIDEQDQERGDEEAERGEELTEEEDKDSHEEDKDSHEEVDVFDNQEHEGGMQEAREENYKRDDASSAVEHDAHVTEPESGTGGGGNADEEQVVDKADDNSNAKGSKVDDDTNSDVSKGEVAGENLDKRVAESGNETNKTNDSLRGVRDLDAGSGGASVGNISGTVPQADESFQTENLSSNVTAADNKDIEVNNKEVNVSDNKVEFSKADDASVSNLTTVEYNSQMERQTNLTMAAESNTQTEVQTNSTVGASDHPSDVQVNSGISTSSNAANLESAQNQNVAGDNVTLTGKDVLASQNITEQAEKSDAISVPTSEGHSAEGEFDNSLFPLVTEEEKNVRIDLSTLPEIQNDVNTTNNDVAE